MGTTVNIHGHSHEISKESSKFWESYHSLINELQIVYFGLIAMVIAAGSALGGISLMFISENHAPVSQMIICIALTLTNNIVAILQFHAKWVVDFFILSVIVNGFLIAINAF